MEKKILMERIYKDLAKAVIEVPKFQKNLEEINKKKEKLEKSREKTKEVLNVIDDEDEDKSFYQDAMEIINKQLSDLEKEKNKNKNSIDVCKRNLEREFNDVLEHYRCKKDPEKSIIGELKLYRENNKESILKMENDLQIAIKNADIDEINRISANLKLLHKTKEIINEKLKKAIYSEIRLKDSKENIEKIINEISSNIKGETKEEIVKKLISEDTLHLFEILDIKKDDVQKEKSEKPKEENSEKSKEENSEKSKEEKSEKPKEENSEKPKEENSEKSKEEKSEKPKEENSEKSKEENSEKTKEKAKKWKPGDPAPDFNNFNNREIRFNGYNNDKDMSYDEYFEKKTKEREALDKEKIIFRWPEEEDKSLVISDEDKSLISKMGTLFTNIKERLKKVKEKIFKKKSKNQKEKEETTKTNKEKEETTKTNKEKEETTKTNKEKEATTKTNKEKEETTKTNKEKEETTKTNTKKKADDEKRGRKKEEEDAWER